MGIRQDENEHLDALVTLKLDGYKRLLARADSAKVKMEIYSSIGDHLSKLEDMVVHGGKGRSVTKMPYAINGYYQRLGNERLQKKIDYVLAKVDGKQAGKILESKEGTRLSKIIKMDYSTFIQCKNDMRKGKAKRTANYAMVARYLLENGYKLGQ